MIKIIKKSYLQKFASCIIGDENLPLLSNLSNMEINFKHQSFNVINSLGFQEVIFFSKHLTFVTL